MGSTPCHIREIPSSTTSRKQADQVQANRGGILKAISSIVLITTEEAAAAPLVFSPTSVESADLHHTPFHTAEATTTAVSNNSSNHKAETAAATQPVVPAFPTGEQYVPPTPLKVAKLRQLLRRCPDSDRVEYVLNGLQHGFALEYEGQFKFRAPQNLPSARQDPQIIKDKLFKEVSLGRMLGPFNSPPLHNLMCSPVGLVPKKNSDELRMIMHLSYPYGGSINDFIDPDKAATQYQKFDDAVQLVIQQGRFCWLAKGDIKSAFKLAPIRYEDLACLGIKFQDMYFVDLTLPFGSAISCAIFEEIACLIHFILENRTRVLFVHYLDDYLWCHRLFVICMSAYNTMVSTAKEIGLPLAPEKMVKPTQVIEFLGLTINTITMTIGIPEDKSEQILKELQELLQLKKTSVKHLQTIAGRLNFITKAVPHGRPFSQKFYGAIAGMKQSWHVSVTLEMKRDITMWCRFIQEYGGTTPIKLPGTPQVHIYTDATAAVRLGWGAWCGTAWMWDQWDPQFMADNNPSIDFLELYAVIVAVWVWTPQVANKIAVIHSDNMPTVQVLHNKSSHSPSMLLLLRFLTLHCMLNNIYIESSFISGTDNQISDSLSRLQFSRFRRLHRLAEESPTPIPSFLSPLCETTLTTLRV